jgi:asparagine synthase (glutamine-hydrolysing)
LPEYSSIQAERSLLSKEITRYADLTDNSFPFFATFKEHIKNRICNAAVCRRCESETAYAWRYGIEMVYPLADIRLIRFVYSMPTELFKPGPLPRMLFRNLCGDILPDQVRLQPKWNGALTFAFAEYWFNVQFETFSDRNITDYKGMFDLEKYAGMVADFKIERKGIPLVILHYLDELIRRNRGTDPEER